ncbi:MAG: hypothetical protein WCW93_02775 [Candidatus Paceibacterota bacterium]
MFKEEKNVKDSIKDTSSVPAPYQAVGFGLVSYTKINKLITALYMVTDIIDKDEPLRNKLRTLGTGIISDINSIPSNARRKISEIMSFLDIASAVNIISEMNCSILKKEFIELSESILSIQTEKDVVESEINKPNRPINLSEFFGDHNGEKSDTYEASPLLMSKKGISIGHPTPTRIGVQRGSTLLKALSDKINPNMKTQKSQFSHNQDFDAFKKQRRNDIINIIKTLGGNATIKDIKDKVQSSQDKITSLVSCSEKTLQRELVSMVKDSVLNKTGEKRWSRYFLK